MQEKTSNSNYLKHEETTDLSNLRHLNDLSLAETLFKAFKYLDYDRDSDVLYGALRGFKSGYGIEEENGIILRYDWEDNFTGATLVGASELLDEDFLNTL